MRFSLALPLLLASCVSAAADVVPTETDLIMAAQKGDPKIDDGTLPLDNFPEKAAAAVFKKFPSRNVVVTSLSYTLSGKAGGPKVIATMFGYRNVAFAIVSFGMDTSVKLDDKGACTNTCWDKFGYYVFTTCKRTNNQVDCRS